MQKIVEFFPLTQIMHSCSNSIKKQFHYVWSQQSRRNFPCHSAKLKFVIKHVKTVGKYFYWTISFVGNFFHFRVTEKIAFCDAFFGEAKIDWQKVFDKSAKGLRHCTVNRSTKDGFRFMLMTKYKSKSSKKKCCVDASRVSRNHQIDYSNWSPQCLGAHAELKPWNGGREKKGWKRGLFVVYIEDNLFWKNFKSRLVKNRFKMNHLGLNKHLLEFMFESKAHIASSKKQFWAGPRKINTRNGMRDGKSRKINFH